MIPELAGASVPIAATSRVGAGLQLPPELLALVCASRDGSPRHLDRVRRILDTVGLDEMALRTTPALPYDRDAADAVLRPGGPSITTSMPIFRCSST